MLWKARLWIACFISPELAAEAKNKMRQRYARDQEARKSLEYALSIWPDTRGESISREDAAKIAESLSPFQMPYAASADFDEGWEAAIETVAMALRFKAFHM